MRPPDAIVVGAGPAGSIAALLLARAGVRVRLVDRSPFPRTKLCGDTINPGALALLTFLGLGDRVWTRALPLTGMLVTGPDGAAVAADYPHHLRGAAIRRSDLDAMLLDAAIAAGADFMPGVGGLAPLLAGDGSTVIGIRAAGSREERLFADIVIAADGRGSKLASALRLARFAPAPKRWAFGAYFTGVAGLSSRGEMHIRRDGYVGVAPLPDEITNVCVVCDDRAAAAGRSMPAEDIVMAAIAGDPTLRSRFAGAAMVVPPRVLGPLAVDAARAGCSGLLLAGDAAGFIDPMTGDGLRFAIRGGELAAEAAIEELTSGVPAFERLRARRVREFTPKWRINRALRALVASPRAISVATRVAACWPAAVRALVCTAGDVSLARHRPLYGPHHRR